MLNSENRFFEDLAKAATGAVGALSGIRQQIHTEIKSQFNRFVIEMDFVPRDEFDIVESLAREARIQNQKLEARIAELEKKLGVKPKTAAKPAVKKATQKKKKK